jgi:glycosyltransferase involved in cell wall biosynthesis
MENLRISVCVTTFNESEETIKKLVSALNNQTLKPNEIIIIDAKDYNNCSRSKGRNIAIKKAKNEIIAITDAGCIPHRDWLKNLIKPVKNNIVSAGFYEMVTSNHFQEACKMFLGVSNKDIDKDFMPSARSMAFTKTIWKKAGRFPEKMGNTAEDTLFNLNLIKAGAKFKTAKNAIVDWQMPKTIYDFGYKIYGYAKGDAESNIWWHPIKKWQTHNIKILSIFLRYLVLILLFLFNKSLCLLYVLCYMLYGYKKAKWWGVILQVSSDFAVMLGFIFGIFVKSLQVQKNFV